MNKLPIKVTFIPFIPFIVVANSNVLDVKTKNKTLTPKKFFKTLLQFDDASNLMIKKYQGQKVFDTTTPKKKKKSSLFCLLGAYRVSSVFVCGYSTQEHTVPFLMAEECTVSSRFPVMGPTSGNNGASGTQMQADSVANLESRRSTAQM